MKMKKTQSLKLMLLGLMASVSTSALAAVGDVFQYGPSDGSAATLFYEQISETTAKVIGVQTINPANGMVIIPDKCLNTMDGYKSLDVTEIDDNWAGKTVVVIKHQNLDGSWTEYPAQPAFDFENYDGTITLDIQATKLYYVNTDALQSLTPWIEKFIVSPNAGLKAIPKYAFLNAKRTTSVDPAVAAAQQEIIDGLTKAIEAKNNEINGYDTNGVKDGKTTEAVGKKEYEGKQVYLVKADNQGKNYTEQQSFYAIVGDKATDAQGNVLTDEDGKELYKLIQIISSGGYREIGNVAWVKVTTEDDPATEEDEEVTELWNAIEVSGSIYRYKVADMVTTTFGNAHIKGLAEKLQEASEASQAANADVTIAPTKLCYLKALGILNDAKDDYEEALDKQKRMNDNNLVTIWGTSNPAVTFAIAKLSPNGLSAADVATYNSIVTAMQTAHWDLKPATYTAHTYTKGDEVSVLTVSGAQFVEIVQINSVWYQIYYNSNTSKYYAYDLTKWYEATQEAGSSTVSITGYAVVDAITVAGVNQAVTDTKAAYDAAKEEFDGVKFAHNPNGDLICSDEVGASFMDDPKTLPELEKIAEDKAKELADANAALTKAQGELADLEGQKEAAENEDLGEVSYVIPKDNNGKDIPNTVLKEAKLANTALEAYGEAAFKNCTEAAFTADPVLPAAAKVIDDEAFYNASKINPDFSVLTALESIGDEAFGLTATTKADFSNSSNLSDLGENVFDNCKITELKLLGTAIKDYDYPDVLANGFYKEYANFTDACGTEYNKNDAKNLPVNTTLTLVTLPEKIKAIPFQAFYNCINLATLAVIPAGVEEIGAQAFMRTKIAKFDLSALVNLTTIGYQAFAGNPTLTEVILPQDQKDATTGEIIAKAKLTSLPDGAFQCDPALEDITFGPEIECLPAGIFAGNNKIEELDFSKTNLKVLNNLFATGEEIYWPNQYNMPYKEEYRNTALKSIKLPDQVLDTKDNFTVVVPGLKVIMPNALAYMEGLKDVTIPTTVEFMGDGVFYNCQNLETVTAMDSKLTTIGFNSFRNCVKLKTFTFITLNVVEPLGRTWYPTEDLDLDDACDLPEYLTNQAFFVDHNFFIINSGAQPEVIVTKESKKALDDYFSEPGHGYAKLSAWQPEMQLSTGDNTLFSDGYFNENYGTWIPVDQADVYTVYQDLNDIYMVKAKHNQRYYKIPAVTFPEIDGRMPVLPGGNLVGGWYPSALDAQEDVVSDELKEAEEALEGAKSELKYYENKLTEAENELNVLLGQYQNADAQLQSSIQDQINSKKNDIAWWKNAINGYDSSTGHVKGKKELVADAQAVVDQLKKDGMSVVFARAYIDALRAQLGFASTINQMYRPGINGVYNHEYWYDTFMNWYIDGYPSIARPLTPSAACIIIAKTADGKIKYERHSTADKKYQSTLDPSNQLRAVGTPLTISELPDVTLSSNIWQWGYKTGEAHDWFHITSGTIKAGKVVIPLSAAQGNSRVNVIWVDDEATAILGVKEYVKSLKDTDAIYNMQGVRVNATTKGQMYIKGGKKFIQQ